MGLGRRDAWREVTVDEIKATSENALATGPFGSAISARFFQDYGVPVIRGSNLSEDVGCRLKEDGLVFVSTEMGRRFRRSIARAGDLIFTCWGTIGQVGLIAHGATYAEYVVSNKQMKLTPDPEVADSLFLYYCLSGPDCSHQIKSQTIGSSVPGFNLGQLKKIRLFLPSLDEQRAIAYILGTLDDKIELNRRTNQTLEEIARTLFKSWFVDFDPVRAKAEGRPPEGMDAETAALFPDAFEESELGPIPEGWRLVQWGDVSSLEYGKRLEGYKESNGEIPVFGTNGHIGWTFEALSAMPGVIIGRKGAYRGVHFSDCPFYVIDTAFYLAPYPEVISRWAYYMIMQYDINSMDSGSAIPSTSRQAFYHLPLVLPPVTIQALFVDHLDPLWNGQRANNVKATSLSKIRDTLLPKLLSGDLRIDDPDKFLEENVP